MSLPSSSEGQKIAHHAIDQSADRPRWSTKRTGTTTSQPANNHNIQPTCMTVHVSYTVYCRSTCMGEMQVCAKQGTVASVSHLPGKTTQCSVVCTQQLMYQTKNHHRRAPAPRGEPERGWHGQHLANASAFNAPMNASQDKGVNCMAVTTLPCNMPLSTAVRQPAAVCTSRTAYTSGVAAQTG